MNWYIYWYFVKRILFLQDCLDMVEPEITVALCFFYLPIIAFDNGTINSFLFC